MGDIIEDEIFGAVAEIGAHATPLIIVPAAAVYNVKLLAVVMLIVVLKPTLSVNLTMEFAVLAPFPVDTYNSEPIPMFLAVNPKPPPETG